MFGSEATSMKGDVIRQVLMRLTELFRVPMNYYGKSTASKRGYKLFNTG